MKELMDKVSYVRSVHESSVEDRWLSLLQAQNVWTGITVTSPLPSVPKKSGLLEVNCPVTILVWNPFSCVQPKPVRKM